MATGGSAQNVARIAAGILKKNPEYPSKVMFTGCISNDKFGSLMSEKAKEDGVIVNYSICETVPTGTCAVCLTDGGKNRSLCAFLGASQKFSEKHLIDNWNELVEHTNIVYISGFLIAVSPATFHLLGEHVAKSDWRKTFCLNLSAPYVSDVFGNEIEKIMKYVDILFGNDDEALAYAKFKNWKSTNIEDIATMIAQEPKVRKTDRLVVITQGERPVIVVKNSFSNKGDDELKQGSCEKFSFPCEPIPDDEIVDTNGAGDSFVGGFLSQYILNREIKRCVEIGSYSARKIIRVSGIAIDNFDDLPMINHNEDYPEKVHNRRL